MKHLVIGTAGHVDHGKTVLVEKLTGTNTDRLKQEQERGISIELGFTFLTLNNGQPASIIDVPGHEKFIKNMLAGVGGIDMVMLVIAADEGVMPQTREHIDIIQLLQIERGVVVITKKDLVDEELLELAEEDVRDFISRTPLAGAPLVKVSGYTGEGLDELKEKINEVSRTIPPRSEAGIPRVPVDRVFTVTGFGTVITGTLISGSLEVGQNVVVYPQGIQSRIRNIQVHGESRERAGAGQRVAVNLGNVEKAEIERGNVLAPPGTLKPWNRMDIKLHLLNNAPRPLKNRARVRIYIGTSEVLGRVMFLDREEMEPGSDCYAQVVLEEMVPALKNDRFVIRSYSPVRTIGGGKIIDPAAQKHKRMRDDVIETLRRKEEGTPGEMVEDFLNAQKTLCSSADINPVSHLPVEEREQILQGLVKEGRVIKIDSEPELYAAKPVYDEWVRQITTLLHEYQEKYSLREGYPREELRSRKFSRTTAKQFQQLLQVMEKDGHIKLRGQAVCTPDFTPVPGDKEEKLIGLIENRLKKSGFQPPSWDDLCKELNIGENLSNELLQYLVRKEIIIKITDNIYLHRDMMDEAVERVKKHFSENNELTVGGARDLLNTSRKYALPLLEYLDTLKITKRTGDVRVPGKALSS